ncbi:hypothetical protein M0813_15537 [Anaeramoeba flamelloides]|uniref:Uncharacterized protein n=1 Tax=Anaeramoeba flamelloides TaxID=1746091 RepID=A0ABQ8Z1Z3_9EUKA|nr:hypothetical protein M0813_15537 [Anaeramoeba flamelloides]
METETETNNSVNIQLIIATAFLGLLILFLVYFVFRWITKTVKFFVGALGAICILLSLFLPFFVSDGITHSPGSDVLLFAVDNTLGTDTLKTLSRSSTCLYKLKDSKFSSSLKDFSKCFKTLHSDIENVEFKKTGIKERFSNLDKMYKLNFYSFLVSGLGVSFFGALIFLIARKFGALFQLLGFVSIIFFVVNNLGHFIPTYGFLCFVFGFVYSLYVAFR